MPASTISTVATATPPTTPAPLPADVQVLPLDRPLPAIDGKHELLLAPTPGGSIELRGKLDRLTLPEAIVVPRRIVNAIPLSSGEYEGFEAYAATIVSTMRDGMTIITRSEPHRSALEHQVGAAHSGPTELWVVPTLATRYRVATDVHEVQSVLWSDPTKRHVVIEAVHYPATALVVDLETHDAAWIADGHSPSFGPDGTLYYRTGDGGAWVWASSGSRLLGKGRPTTTLTPVPGEPAYRFPEPVTFDGAGKPHWK